MPEGDPAPVNEPTSGDPGTPPAPPSGATFTQADVDRINADTRRKAEDSALRRTLEALGVENIDQAKEVLAAHKAAEEASKTELQRAQEENAALKALAEQAKTQAHTTLVLSRVENALRDAGINPARVEGALRLAPLAEVKVADDGSVAGVAEAVERVKTASPEWFGAPGLPFSAPDASGSPSSLEVDFREASEAAYTAELAKYNIKPRIAGISY